MKTIVVIAAMLFIGNPLFSQKISPYLYSQNAWYIGGGYTLDGLWAKVKKSNVRMVRIGGEGPDFNLMTDEHYISAIDSIRKIGAEPLVQVSYGGGKYTATQAARLVDYINNVQNRNVKYWSIANEPNLAPVSSPETVASYTKSFASAMKAKDPTILISAIEAAWYDVNYYPRLVGGDLDITGKDANGRFYVDIVSFHAYFSNLQRDTVINWPTATYTSSNPEIGNGFTNYVNDLTTRMASADAKWGRTGTQKLQWAVTEFHLVNNHLVNNVNSVEGNGTHSFLAGQHWCQMFGVGIQKGALTMAPWSIFESSGNRSNQDLGYLDGPNQIPRSTYYHEMMMSENVHGNYITSTSNQRTVKIISSKDVDQVGIIVLNMNASSNFNYSLRLDNVLSGSSSPLKFRVNAGIAVEYTGLINAQSTTVLVFDLQGKLVKKLDYSLSDAQQNKAPSVTTGPTSPPPPPPTNPQTPYAGSSAVIPGKIEAEDFDKGGEGIAYKDSDTSNNGGKYRTTEGVDIQSTTDAGGGFNVGWTNTGEWIEYTVNVSSAGTYKMEARVAAPNANGKFHIEFDGSDKTGIISVQNTGGWQKWVMISKDVTLSVGVQVMRIYFDAGGLNLNSISFATIAITPPPPPPSDGQTPYFGTVPQMPGRIEAENFDKGGEGIAYHDTETSNFGWNYRTSEGVDIEGTSDVLGGYNVGWIQAGEWMEYAFKVSTRAQYGFTIRVASALSGKKFHLKVDGVNVTGSITVPKTNGYQNWQNVSKSGILLEAGTHVLQFYAETDGFNLNWIDIYNAGTARSSNVDSTKNSDGLNISVYPNPSSTDIKIAGTLKKKGIVSTKIVSIEGITILRKMDDLESGEFIQRIDVSSLKQGLYIIEVEYDNYKMLRRLYTN